MYKKYLDVLEPYKEECLFSWVIRMLRQYSPAGKINSHYMDTMKFFFGENVSFPGLYFQNGLAILLIISVWKKHRYFLH